MDGITKIDRQDGIAQAWHGKTNIRTQGELNEFADSAWDYSVNRAKTGIQIVVPKGNLIESKELYRYYTECDGVEYNLRTCFDSFGDLPNAELWDMFRILIDEFGGNVASVMTCNARTIAAVGIAMPDSGFSIQRGNIQENAFQNVCIVKNEVSNETTKIFSSITLPVCQNTVRAALSERKRATKLGGLNFQLRRSKNVQARIAEIKGAIAYWAAEKELMKEAFEELESKKISRSDLTAFAVGFASNGNELSTRARNTSRAYEELALNGLGNRGETRFDALNGITEFHTRGFDWGRIGEKARDKDPLSLYVSSEFGSSAAKKVEALETLLDDEALEKLCAKGEKLLEEFEGKLVTK